MMFAKNASSGSKKKIAKRSTKKKVSKKRPQGHDGQRSELVYKA